MRHIDRWKGELDDIVRRLGPAGEARQALAVRDSFERSFRDLPRDFIDEILMDLPTRWKRGRDGALAWLGAIGSILLRDYDGAALEKADWEELREALADSGGELDLELLTYAMALVVEKGYL